MAIQTKNTIPGLRGANLETDREVAMTMSVSTNGSVTPLGITLGCLCTDGHFVQSLCLSVISGEPQGGPSQQSGNSGSWLLALFETGFSKRRDESL